MLAAVLEEVVVFASPCTGANGDEDGWRLVVRAEDAWPRRVTMVTGAVGR